MKQVSVYCDVGISPTSYKKLLKALTKSLKNNYIISPVERPFFLSGDWEKRTALLVIPGGQDRFYQSALQGEPNRRIRHFVEYGGRFLGICAGGYYGASSIEFDKGGLLEIEEERELCFYRGRAVGPAYKDKRFGYQSEEGARAAPILWKGGTHSIYFNGGCLFEGAKNDATTEILGRYSDLPGKPAAAILCKVSLGLAILCGVHPEYHPHFFWEYLLNKILT